MNFQNPKKSRSARHSKKRGKHDKNCMVCCSEFTYSPTTPWADPLAVPKNIRKKELIEIKNDDTKAFLDVWEKHREDVGNYQITLHKSQRKSHSLCLDCAVQFVIAEFKELDNRLFKGLKVNDFILCYKSECDKVREKDSGTSCKKRIKLETLHLLFPPVPIGILEGFDRIVDLYKEFNFHKHDKLPCVIKKLSDRLLGIFDSSVPKRRCIKKDCSGIMILSEAYMYQRWICGGNNCTAELCCECNANHSQMTCQEFRRKIIWDDETRTMLEKDVKEGKAKHCPKCDQLIQKDGGCNHMQCHLCETHFCWICLWNTDTKTNDFTENPVYQHMEREHRGYS